RPWCFLERFVHLEFVCCSKFCPSVCASFSCVVSRIVLFASALLKLGRNFLVSSFSFFMCYRTSLSFRRVCAERPAAQTTGKTTDNEVNSIAECVNRFVAEVSLREISPGGLPKRNCVAGPRPRAHGTAPRLRRRRCRPRKTQRLVVTFRINQQRRILQLKALRRGQGCQVFRFLRTGGVVRASHARGSEHSKRNGIAGNFRRAGEAVARCIARNPARFRECQCCLHIRQRCRSGQILKDPVRASKRCRRGILLGWSCRRVVRRGASHHEKSQECHANERFGFVQGFPPAQHETNIPHEEEMRNRVRFAPWRGTYLFVAESGMRRTQRTVKRELPALRAEVYFNREFS